MAPFLRDPEVLKADLICIQEPWRNPYQDTTHHPANRTHQLLYPVEFGEQRTRVCMYISRSINPNTWKHTAHSPDVQELELTDADGRTVRVFNIYNQHREVGTATLDLLNSLTNLTNHTDRTNPHFLLLGDFNLHHPVWGGEGAERDQEGDQLLELMDKKHLDLWLEPGVTTWESRGSRSTIDLVIGSQDLTPRLVSCTVDIDIHADSDHLPIHTLLDIHTATPEAQRRRNWKACNVKDLQAFVDLNLNNKAFVLETKQQIELGMDYLTETVRQGIATSTPWAKPSRWANPCFTPECREMVKITRKFRREYTQAKGNQHESADVCIHDAASVAWAKYAKRVAKWCRNREARGGLIPTLNTEDGPAETAEQKVEAFRRVFFPLPPPADLSNINTTQLPQQIDFPVLQQHEVLKCIRRAPPDKAPGPDGIPNKVWHWLGEVGHNPEYFQQSTTVVLRKAAPRDYRIPKSYRPIALLNTLGISVDHLIQLLLDNIFEAWGSEKKVSMLLLDVAGAFDNVSHIRLLHNLRTVRLCFFANWLESFLSNRQTRIQLPGYVSNPIPTSTGIPQGSPISPILFQHPPNQGTRRVRNRDTANAAAAERRQQDSAIRVDRRCLRLSNLKQLRRESASAREGAGQGSSLV
ncbi:hypothetical protein EYZ11_013084 [Aspergillus tanneri]|uniref:Reverse transcriptase domain-containing protein n=1 Tax=Aspergillus tanneri TaxID=1220188 RepID=A0A4S3IYK8_9EURO|nr:hypothetical protein EYZ11_013084 [Aspergillus tanneri]